MAPFSKPSSCLVSGISIWTISTLEGQCSLLFGIDRMIKICIQHRGFHATLVLTKGLISTAKEVKQWNSLLFIMYLDSLRCLSFIEWFSDLLKTLLQLQAGDNALPSC